MKVTNTNKKSKKLRTVLLSLGAISVVLLYAISDKESLSEKYNVGATSAYDRSGKEVSYINLTGKKMIDEKQIKLSDGYWTSGRFGF